jgi:hypothetical protein
MTVVFIIFLMAMSRTATHDDSCVTRGAAHNHPMKGASSWKTALPTHTLRLSGGRLRRSTATINFQSGEAVDPGTISTRHHHSPRRSALAARPCVNPPRLSYIPCTAAGEVSDVISDDIGLEEAVPVDWLPRGVFLLEEERQMMDERGFEDDAEAADAAPADHASARHCMSRLSPDPLTLANQ